MDCATAHQGPISRRIKQTFVTYAMMETSHRQRLTGHIRRPGRCLDRDRQPRTRAIAPESDARPGRG